MSREELIKEQIEKDKSGNTDRFGLPDQGFELTEEQLGSITGGDDDEKTNALDKLFSVIGPKMANRNGGYTRQLKLGNRRGDDAPIVLVTWVE